MTAHMIAERLSLSDHGRSFRKLYPWRWSEVERILGISASGASNRRLAHSKLNIQCSQATFLFSWLILNPYSGCGLLLRTRLLGIVSVLTCWVTPLFIAFLIAATSDSIAENRHHCGLLRLVACIGVKLHCVNDEKICRVKLWSIPSLPRRDGNPIVELFPLQ